MEKKRSMNTHFLSAAALILCAAAIHSGLGESWILRRLDPKNLPPTPFGGPAATHKILRASWHLLTMVWLVLAAALVLSASQPVDPRGQGVGLVIGAIFATMGGGIVASSLLGNPRMLLRHPAWLFFLVIAALAWAGCR